ncbi:MAG: ornithine cyclodeaminase family protein [Erysipelotrichaceae bacterium]|nr:ornithine cyclodeaminase family protein [Erysipelotrichaceae bacterium]
MNLPYYDAKEVKEKLKMSDCIGLMEKVFRGVEEGECTQYLRTALTLPTGNILAFMPSYFDEGYFGAKILSVYPQNYLQGLPSHQGLIVLFEKETGRPTGLVDANAVTRIRTGACSAVASKTLAGKEVRKLALIGAGEQARPHLEAHLLLYPQIMVSCTSPRREETERFAKWAFETFGVSVEVADSAAEAAKDADILCTLTPSKEPVLSLQDVKKGAHINAVGACRPDSRELSSELVKESSFFGDNKVSVMNEAGDLLIPIREGLLSEDHFRGTLGEVLCGRKEGRKSEEEITVFESLGMAAEDLICAQLLCEGER